jgi:N,N'-diacetyllegionaminate synthase
MKTNPPIPGLPKPFIIAEIGGNHEGNFDYAKKLLCDAADSGAHAVKFQTYVGDKIVSKVEGETRNKHFKKFELSNEQWLELIDLAQKEGIMFMSSVWDLDSLELVDPHVSVHKIGSGDLTNYPLIEKILAKEKPTLFSTAMATMEEVKASHQVRQRKRTKAAL